MCEFGYKESQYELNGGIEIMSCKSCTSRYVGCHSECSDYILSDIINKIRRHNKMVEHEMNIAKYESIARSKRRGRR